MIPSHKITLPEELCQIVEGKKRQENVSVPDLLQRI